MVLSIFSCACWPLVYHLWKNVCAIFLLSCRSYLYMLNINPLLCIWFANIFYPFVGCLYSLLFVSFDACVYVSPSVVSDSLWPHGLWCIGVLNFDIAQFIYFYVCWLCFWCHIQEIIAKSNVMKLFLYDF